MGKTLMGMYVNRITLIGNAGQDPEVKTQQFGDMANFTLATSTKNREGVEKTEWHRIIARGNLVPIVNKIVQKGGKYYIEGKMTYRQYTDSNGQKKSIPEIVLYEIIACSPKDQYQMNPAGGGYPTNSPEQEQPGYGPPPEKPVYAQSPDRSGEHAAALPRYPATPPYQEPTSGAPPAHTEADLPPDDDLPF